MTAIFEIKNFYLNSEFISTLYSSKTKEVELDLSGNERKANYWKALGFVDTSFLESIENDDLKHWAISFTH